MADLNKVFLIGRLTQDPELRYTPGGAPVTDLRLATSRSFQPDEGERREETLYIDITVWNRQAENCCQYLTKGRAVHVEGYLKVDSWEDKNTGEKRNKIKVVAERVQFLDSGRRDDAGAGSQRDDEARPSSPRGNPPRVVSGDHRAPDAASRPPAGTGSAARGRSAEVSHGEDDIPF
jgi:single-strand DNA-binding protein